MSLETEPIGSIPRPPDLIGAVEKFGAGDPRVEPIYQRAVRDTIAAFEATGSPVIADGDFVGLACPGEWATNRGSNLLGS